jgi:catechol 2,3-dioxygenase-like lactoylglutathione lyase family enzyme
MHRGSCLCGAVTFEVDAGALAPPAACHCSQCRKQSGHVWASTDVARAVLTIHGAERLTWYRSSEKVRRGFCATCGSFLFWDPDGRDSIAVAMGAFEKPTGARLEQHIFTDDKGDYYEFATPLVFDHLSLGVADLERSTAFYDAALTPLGYVRLLVHPRAAGWGPAGYTGEPPFAIVVGGDEARAPGKGFHLAFAASDRAAVDGFYAAALAHGGVDEGPPGIRLNYNPGYYAAFVRDLDGHRIEAVRHER